MKGCIKCGECLRVCHAYQLGFPGPRRIAVEYSRIGKHSQDVLMCTSCGICEEVCPSSLKITDAIIQMKKQMFPPQNDGQLKVLRLAEKTNHAVEPKVYEAPEEGKTLIFPGCVGKGRLVANPENIISLLMCAGAEPYIDPNLVCCGSPLLKMGAEEESERLKEINHPILEKAEQVITVCPGCTVMINKYYGINALHILEYLKDLHLEYPDGEKLNIYLHQPCHLSRGVGKHTIDIAKNILQSIPNVTLLNCGTEEDCCGGGGGVLAAHPKQAYAAAERKAENARNAGADIIIAACPFCAINLRRPKILPAMEFSEFLLSRIRNEGLNKSRH